MIATVTWVEARDATKHVSRYTIVTLTTKNYLAQNINSAQVKKPWTHLVSTLSQEAYKEDTSFGSLVYFIFCNRYPKI